MKRMQRSSLIGPLVCLMLLFFAGCARQQVAVIGLADLPPETLWAEPNFWDPIPPSSSTEVPAEIADDYWHSQFVRVNQAVAEAEDCDLVFFGDSITAGWSLLNKTGLPVWQQRYAPYNPINMGNSGDITPVMLYRVTHGNLDFPPGQQPKVAVLLCGTNNYVVKQSDGGKVKWDLGIDTPPEEVASGARAIAQVFRRKLPETRVIMLGIFPVKNQNKWQRVQKTNAFNAQFTTNDNEVVFMDLQGTFLLDDGSLNPDLFTDGTHLTEAGYTAWADAIAPELDRMMSAPPLDPLRIMLIGDAITAGKDSASTYRRYLDPMLRKDGLLIDFVGSETKHNRGKTEPDSYEFDPDHEAYWAGTTEWMVRQLPKRIEANIPDVAVIHLGTTDIIAEDTFDDGSVAYAVNNIDQIIATLRENNPSVRIVLSQILPIPGRADAVARLNKAIFEYAQSNNTPASPIIVADQNTGFDPATALQKQSPLPTPATAHTMARIYAAAILEFNAAEGTEQ